MTLSDCHNNLASKQSTLITKPGPLFQNIRKERGGRNWKQTRFNIYSSSNLRRVKGKRGPLSEAVYTKNSTTSSYRMH